MPSCNRADRHCTCHGVLSRPRVRLMPAWSCWSCASVIPEPTDTVDVL
jgi:hypothetical protein